MKTYKHLFEQIASFENLYGAFLDASCGKQYRRELILFEAHLESNLRRLQQELFNGTYRTGSYKQFYVFEPKKRLIMALPFRDRVLQWAIYRVINPIFDRSFIHDSFGCRVGRGTHNAAVRVQYWLRQIDRHCKATGDKYYYLKLDIKKYFHRVDHQVLLKIIGRKIKDERLMKILEDIICNDEIPFGVSLENPVDDIYAEHNRVFDVGMPIGNLLSQLFANIYLNELDQFCKYEIGCHYYIRYMDDIVIMDNSKEHLHYYKNLIKRFIGNELKLVLNSKTAIRPVTLGVDFVGFKIFSTHKFLRKKSMLKIKRAMKKIRDEYLVGKLCIEEVECSVQSYLGIMSHANTYSFYVKIMDWFAVIPELKQAAHCKL